MTRRRIKSAYLKVLHFVFGVYLYFVDTTLILLFRSVPSSRKVLIVRLDNIGDYLIWAGQLSALRSKYPSDEFDITLVGNKAWTELAEQTHIFDRIIPVDPKRFIRSIIYRARIAREVRRGNFGIAISPVYSRGFFGEDSIIRVSGAFERIGYVGDYSNVSVFLKKISDRWFTWLIPASAGASTEFQRSVDFMQGLGIESTPRLAHLPVNPDCLPAGLGRGEYFVLFTGASKSIRCWPIERFAEVAMRIQSVSRLKAVICGTASESVMAQRLSRLMPAPVVDLCGKTSLTELVSIIGNAQILVTNETSAAHIGPAVNTDTVCIMGGGHFGRFMPYPELSDTIRLRVVYRPMECYCCNWQCKYPLGSRDAAPCVSTVEVDDVWSSVKEFLDLH